MCYVLRLALLSCVRFGLSKWRWLKDRLVDLGRLLVGFWGQMIHLLKVSLTLL